MDKGLANCLVTLGKNWLIFLHLLSTSFDFVSSFSLFFYVLTSTLIFLAFVTNSSSHEHLYVNMKHCAVVTKTEQSQSLQINFSIARSIPVSFCNFENLAKFRLSAKIQHPEFFKGISQISNIQLLKPYYL